MKHAAPVKVLKEIEAAIETRNFGRMNDIGNSIIERARNDCSWLEAVIVITGYLAKSEGHLWDAVNLSKQAAVMAPDQTAIQDLAIKAMTRSIAAFKSTIDRVRAAHSVVVYAPKDSIVLVISIDLMLGHVLGLPEVEDRYQYARIAVHYAPEKGPVREKAQAQLEKEKALRAKTANANDPDIEFLSAQILPLPKKNLMPTDKEKAAAEEMLSFKDKHKDLLNELFDIDL